MKERKINATECLTTALYGLIASIYAIGAYMNGGSDNDFLFHTRVGEFICKNGQLPQVDPFSWIAKERGWKDFAHSWVSDVIIYLFSLIHENVNLSMMFYVGVTAFLVYVTARIFILKQNDYLALVSAVAIGDYCSNPRPQNLSFLLFFIMMDILYQTYQKEEYKGYFFLPLLSLIWANIHGGAIIMFFAFIGLFAVISFLPELSFDTFFLKCTNPKAKWRLSLILPACVLAGLINPYSYQSYYYFVFVSTEDMKKYIGEWQPTAFGDFRVLIPLALIAVCFLFPKKEKVDAVYLVPIACCLILSMKYVRITTYAGFYCIPLMRWYFGEEKQQNLCKKIPDQLPLFLMVSISCLFLYTFLLPVSVPEKTLTKQQLDYFQSSGYQRLYHSMDMGDMLLYDGIPCFTDSRSDLYEEKTFVESIEFECCMEKEDGMRERFLETYDFDGVALLAERCAAISYMRQREDFAEDYRDDKMVVFKKITEEGKD